MRDWLALKKPLAVAVVVGAAVLVQWGLVSRDIAEPLVPPPEQTAEQFLKAVKAHNYGAARHTLKRDLQAQVTEGDLQTLARELEERPPGLWDAEGVSATVQSKTASATVDVRLDDGRQQELEFSLEKENGLWKLSSIGPAWVLGAPPRP
jgi:Domain of unknown function (DUF4878)